MTPEVAARLRVIQQQAEALSAQGIALSTQIAALVSEAEHGEQVQRAGETVPSLVREEPQFHNQFGRHDAEGKEARPARQRRPPR